MKNYWFSFSYNGRNTGVCIVQADCEHSALEKTINLGLHPQHDDILCFEMDNMEDDRDLEYNVLYSREDMVGLGYESVKNIE